jgi:hypothetical protein
MSSNESAYFFDSLNSPVHDRMSTGFSTDIHEEYALYIVV